ncbi:DUF1989 domain-containing protein [Sneathiella aquimaris]|uniref:DUF1989 domain-containing protein n=1 Tax=Sneathiella aquimaris TaxID=2599305 RepID=UPI00146E8C09|nr:urea carboxylase-associated family protein [Sneathiella aquimaris]
MRPETSKTIELAAKSGCSAFLKKGQLVNLIDVDGAQVADLFACKANSQNEWISTSHTRTKTGRLFPKIGQSFCSQNYENLLMFLKDTSPGYHDMFYPSCDPALYNRLLGSENHPNCFDNFWHAAKRLHWNPPVIPDPVNFFQNTPTDQNGNLLIRPAASLPGNSVLLKAETDLILVVTACSQDLAPINGDKCTDLRIDIFDEDVEELVMQKKD